LVASSDRAGLLWRRLLARDQRDVSMTQALVLFAGVIAAAAIGAMVGDRLRFDPNDLQPVYNAPRLVVTR
jgi:hypothetical protein